MKNQLFLDLFTAADAVLGASVSEKDLRKLRELLTTGLVKVHVELTIDQRGASEVVGRISQSGRKTGTLFHFTKRDEAEEKRIIRPNGFTHSL